MIENLKEFVVNHSQLVIHGIEAIERSPSQIAFIVDDSKKLLGIMTNGDVRRFFLRGGTPDSNIKDCINREFHSVNPNTSREEILKLFDLGFLAIPVVSEDGSLTGCVTLSEFRPTEEKNVLARARAPVRISFSGGGSDLTYYFMHQKGAVLHATIGLYAHATLIPSQGQQIRIYSHDIDREEHYNSLNELMDSPNKGLLSSAVSVIRPEFGFELFVHSDFPIGSGLGGSSAVVISVVSAFNELRLDKWTTYEVAELAFHAERLCFGISGGWQDQYAAAFGGFNLIEFGGKRNMVHSLRLEDDILNELEECLMLCDTGIKHDSGQLHDIQRKEFAETNSKAQVERMVELSRQMHRYLICGDLKEFGNGLHEAWLLKHSLSSAISDSHIDKIYESARSAGVLGGKLLGAGGGGFFLFFVLPRHRAEVTARLKLLGCKLSTLRFEREGVKSWRTKVL